MPEAVLFDMDGVLIDSEQQWRLVENPAFIKILPDWKEEDHRRVVGLGVEDLYHFFAANYSIQTSQQDFSKICDEIAREVYMHKVSLFPGAEDLLQGLRSRRTCLALVSSSPHHWIRMAMNRFSLSAYFDAIVSADDVEGKGKPSPAIYRFALKQLEISARKSIAVEDSSHGLQAAKAAGIYCVAFRNGANDDQDLSIADAEIRRLSELGSVKMLT